MQVNFLDPQFPYHGSSRKKMTAVVFLSLLLGVVLLGTTWAGAKVFGTATITPVTTKMSVAPLTFWDRMKQLVLSSNRALKGAANDRVNIAIFGIGGAGHDGAQLTDTILVMSIKPSTKQIALISLPRDTVVNIPKFGYRKINEVNALNELEEAGSGPAAATAVLENFLGLEIPYYARVDFSGFADLIDALGGVDVFVDKSFADYEFPNSTYGLRTVSFNKGWQHFDGQTALDFARSRHGNNFEGSDFARARRQQKIVLAVRDKILTNDTFVHPARILSLIRTLDNHVSTNLQINDLLEGVRLAKELDTNNLINTVFSDDTSSVLYADVSTGAFYLRPKDPTLQQIHWLTQNIFDEQVANGAKTVIDAAPLQPLPHYDAKIELQNGTWRPGFAAREKKRLERDDFIVSAVGNAALRPVTTVQIFDVTHKYPAVIEKLKKRYNAVEIINRPPPSPDAEGAVPSVDIVVVLGDNIPDFAE